tara:strand:- start:86 stop:1387 length:1302 start_codon:yes stop_codon:yes gene_type:complete
MAELKVDKILPATGSSIALSESGKTVTIPSGATLDASAATLTNIGAAVDYCSSLKTSPFTASASRGYFINTGSAVTVTLPSSPSVGDQVIVIDATGNASSNNITLDRNGSKIKGGCINADLQTDRVGVRIVYSGSSQGWVTATSANETAPALVTAQYISASGGTETTSGNFKIHTFTGDGTFTVSAGGNAGGSNTVSYVVVAGGGATIGYNSKGGGAGGYREGLGVNDSYTGSPLRNPTGVPVTASPGSYPITVGGGGTGGTSGYPSTATSSQKGSSSVFSTITSTGGGSGTGGSVSRPSCVANGGSGGNGATGNTPPVSPPQGNDGGSGGGGGAGEAGDTDGSGYGGDGVSSEITGSAVVRAGGGGGGGGPGGDGGGGPSVGGSTPTFVPGTNGTANTGGGAGGGTDWTSSSGPSNASGGSGIVIIRYKFQN